jgi:hypothetical protein
LMYAKDGAEWTLAETISGEGTLIDGAGVIQIRLDWRGRKMVWLASNRISSPGTLSGFCRTYGLSEEGWVLQASQNFTGDDFLAQFSELSPDGQRLALAGRSEATGDDKTYVYAWDVSKWVKNESFSRPAYSGDPSFTGGERIVMRDTATIMTYDPFADQYREYGLEDGALSGSVGAARNSLVPPGGAFRSFFRRLGLIDNRAASAEGAFTAGFNEYRKTTGGWQLAKTHNFTELVEEGAVRYFAISDDGTQLHTLSYLPDSITWQWFFRTAPITRLPPGYTPAPDAPYPDEDLGPNNEPRAGSYALFWTAFNETYEVP